MGIRPEPVVQIQSCSKFCHYLEMSLFFMNSYIFSSANILSKGFSNDQLAF